MNSRQDKEFLEKKMHFLGDILHILGDFRGKFCLLGGHFGPGPRQDKGLPPRDLGIIRISW